MKAMRSLILAAAVAVAGLACADVQAASGHTWSGTHGGHWTGGNWSGGHWSGGHRFWGPRVGFFVGAPVLFGPWYWGYPYDYYYPRTVLVDRVIERYPASYPEGVMESAPPTTEAPPAPGAPAQGPSYMNYCASANAYYPKVTTCPEGWKFVPSR